jgi:hypothetical protein
VTEQEAEMSNLYRGPSTDASYQVVSEKNFKKSTNQKQELPVGATFINGSINANLIL